MSRRINDVLKGIMTGAKITREDMAGRMGCNTTKDELDKHFENDSSNGWRIARMSELLHLPTLPSEWFLKGDQEDSKR